MARCEFSVRRDQIMIAANANIPGTGAYTKIGNRKKPLKTTKATCYCDLGRAREH